jgi:hypothetical protein
MKSDNKNAETVYQKTNKVNKDPMVQLRCRSPQEQQEYTDAIAFKGLET